MLGNLINIIVAKIHEAILNVMKIEPKFYKDNNKFLFSFLKTTIDH